MKFNYDRIEHNNLYDLLSHEDICQALAYMVDFRSHRGFNTIAHKHSIEICTDSVTVCVILFAGFEVEEYKTLQFRNNLHLVSFSSAVLNMHEFNELIIKIIDKHALLFTILSRTKDYYGELLNSLKDLEV